MKKLMLAVPLMVGVVGQAGAEDRVECAWASISGDDEVYVFRMGFGTNPEIKVTPEQVAQIRSSPTYPQKGVLVAALNPLAFWPKDMKIVGIYTQPDAPEPIIRVGDRRLPAEECKKFFPDYAHLMNY